MTVDESRRRGLLGSRLDPEQDPSLHDEGAGLDSAIQTALAGVMCHLARHRLIIRQFS